MTARNLIAALLVGATFLLGTSRSPGQTPGTPRAGEGGGISEILASPSQGLESPVDPSSYETVPGDLLALGLWGTLDTLLAVAVGPEGNLVIPSVGVVPVAGLTLEESRERVRERVRELFPSSRVTLTLVRMGTFRVEVTGLVARPGSYPATGQDRLRDLLEAAGGIRPGGSYRRIQVVRDSSRAEADLVGWSMHGDESQNPPLRPGTRVHVPPRASTFRLRGPVEGGLEPLFPPSRATSPMDRFGQPPQIALEWKEGDTVDDAIRRAGGLTPEALQEVVYLWRRQPGTRRALTPEVIRLCADSLGDVAVYPGDLVDIPYREEWVAVTGAVHRPGRYPFLAGWRARDYVNAAGGPSTIGKRDHWTVRREGEGERAVEPDAEVAPGDVLRVPETFTHKASTLMATASTAVALILSIVALAK